MNDQRVTRPSRIGDEWILLSEVDLKPELDVDRLVRGAGAVVDALRGLHLPRERLDRISAVISSAIEGFYGRYDAGIFVPAIRVNVLAAARAMRTAALFPIEPLSKGVAAFDTGLQRGSQNSSWGFFIIEKSAGKGYPNGGRSPHVIELFLYPEGRLS